MLSAAVKKVKNKIVDSYSKVKTDKKNFDFQNENESDVLEANYFSAYKETFWKYCYKD